MRKSFVHNDSFLRSEWHIFHQNHFLHIHTYGCTNSVLSSFTACSIQLHISHSCAVTHSIHTFVQAHKQTMTKGFTSGFWLLTAFEQPEADASVLTQPLVFSLLASYRGSAKQCLQHTVPCLCTSLLALVLVCFPKVMLHRLHNSAQHTISIRWMLRK